MTNRERTAQNMACPTCKSDPLTPCRSQTGRIQTVRAHQSRVDAWQAWSAEQAAIADRRYA